MKRLAALIIAVIVLALVLYVPAYAIDPFDTSKTLSLSVSFAVDGNYMSGVRFSLYRTANMTGYGDLTLTDAFKSCGATKLVDLTSAQSQALCEKFYAYLENHKTIAADDTGLTDKNGVVTFPTQAKKLVPGLYLLVSERFFANGVSHEAAPFIVSLPYRGADDKWIYSMSVAPKAADTRIDVQKLWQDSGYERYRPAYIKVALMKGDEKTVYDVAVLSAENGWHYSWDNLPGGYQWSVSESIQSSSYRSYTERVPGGFRIINTYIPPVGPILPQTGLMWWPIPVLASAGVSLFIIGWDKRRKYDK